MSYSSENARQATTDLNLHMEATAAWLRKEGHLDSTPTLGNVATQIVVEQAGGRWSVPLMDGIDVVDEDDSRCMDQNSVLAYIERPGITNGLGAPEIVVSWTGTDDESRHSGVDLANMTFEPSQQ